MDELLKLCAKIGASDEEDEEEITENSSQDESQPDETEKEVEQMTKRIRLQESRSGHTKDQGGNKDEEKEERLKRQQEDMKKIALDAKGTAKSASALSDKRREAMKKIIKDDAESILRAKKKTVRRVTVIDRMHSKKTQEGPMKVLYNCLKFGIKSKVWIRRYNGVRGVITGYIVAFDLHMNLAMMDVSEVYTIETWMIGDPLPKKRANRKKKSSQITYDFKTENKENNMVVKKDLSYDTKTPMAKIRQQTAKKDSTTDFLKQLAEKMKSAVFKPTVDQEVKDEPIKSENNESRDEKPLTTSVIPSSSTSVDNNTTVVTTADIAKQAASLISDDLWSLLQNINVKKVASITSEPETKVSSVESTNTKSASQLPGDTKQSTISQKPFSFNGTNTAAEPLTNQTQSPNNFTNTQQYTMTTSISNRPTVSTANTSFQTEEQTKFAHLTQYSSDQFYVTPSSIPSNDPRLLKPTPVSTSQVISLASVQPLSIDTKMAHRPRDPRCASRSFLASPTPSQSVLQCETNFDKAPLPNSFLPSGRMDTPYFVEGPITAGAISPATRFSPDISQSPLSSSLSYSPREKNANESINYPTDPRKARSKAILDPRLQRRRTESLDSNDGEKTKTVQKENTSSTVEVPTKPKPSLSSTLNLTATEEAIIMGNFGAKKSKPIEKQQPSEPPATLLPPSVTPSVVEGSPTPCKSPDKSGKSPADKSNKSGKSGKPKSRKKLPSPVEEETIKWQEVFSKLTDVEKDFVFDSDQENCCFEERLVESTFVTYRSTKEECRKNREPLSNHLSNHIGSLRHEKERLLLQQQQEQHEKQQQQQQQQQQQHQQQPPDSSAKRSKKMKKLKDLTELDIHKLLGSIHKSDGSEERTAGTEVVDQGQLILEILGKIHGTDTEKPGTTTVEIKQNETKIAECAGEEDLYGDMSIPDKNDANKEDKKTDRNDVWNQDVFQPSSIVEVSKSPAKATTSQKLDKSEKELSGMKEKEIKSRTSEKSKSSKDEMKGKSSINKNIESLNESLALLEHTNLTNRNMNERKCSFIFHSVGKRLREIKKSRSFVKIERKMVGEVLTKMTPLFSTPMMRQEMSTTDEDDEANSSTKSGQSRQKSCSKSDKKKRKKKKKKNKKEDKSIKFDRHHGERRKSRKSSTSSSASSSNEKSEGKRKELEAISDDAFEDDENAKNDLDRVSSDPFDSCGEKENKEKLESVSPDPLDSDGLIEEEWVNSDSSDDAHFKRSRRRANDIIREKHKNKQNRRKEEGKNREKDRSEERRSLKSGESQKTKKNIKVTDEALLSDISDDNIHKEEELSDFVLQKEMEFHEEATDAKYVGSTDRNEKASVMKKSTAPKIFLDSDDEPPIMEISVEETEELNLSGEKTKASEMKKDMISKNESMSCSDGYEEASRQDGYKIENISMEESDNEQKPDESMKNEQFKPTETTEMIDLEMNMNISDKDFKSNLEDQDDCHKAPMHDQSERRSLESQGVNDNKIKDEGIENISMKDPIGTNLESKTIVEDADSFKSGRLQAGSDDTSKSVGMELEAPIVEDKVKQEQTSCKDKIEESVPNDTSCVSVGNKETSTSIEEKVIAADMVDNRDDNVVQGETEQLDNSTVDLNLGDEHLKLSTTENVDITFETLNSTLNESSMSLLDESLNEKRVDLSEMKNCEVMIEPHPSLEKTDDDFNGKAEELKENLSEGANDDNAQHDDDLEESVDAEEISLGTSDHEKEKDDSNLKAHTETTSDEKKEDDFNLETCTETTEASEEEDADATKKTTSAKRRSSGRITKKNTEDEKSKNQQKGDKKETMENSTTRGRRSLDRNSKTKAKDKESAEEKEKEEKLPCRNTRKSLRNKEVDEKEEKDTAATTSPRNSRKSTREKTNTQKSTEKSPKKNLSKAVNESVTTSRITRSSPRKAKQVTQSKTASTNKRARKTARRNLTQKIVKGDDDEVSDDDQSTLVDDSKTPSSPKSQNDKSIVEKDSKDDDEVQNSENENETPMDTVNEELVADPKTAGSPKNHDDEATIEKDLKADEHQNLENDSVTPLGVVDKELVSTIKSDTMTEELSNMDRISVVSDMIKSTESDPKDIEIEDLKPDEDVETTKPVSYLPDEKPSTAKEKVVETVVDNLVKSEQQNGFAKEESSNLSDNVSNKEVDCPNSDDVTIKQESVSMSDEICTHQDEADTKSEVCDEVKMETEENNDFTHIVETPCEKTNKISPDLSDISDDDDADKNRTNISDISDGNIDAGKNENKVDKGRNEDLIDISEDEEGLIEEKTMVENISDISDTDVNEKQYVDNISEISDAETIEDENKGRTETKDLSDISDITETENEAHTNEKTLVEAISDISDSENTAGSKSHMKDDRSKVAEMEDGEISGISDLEDISELEEEKSGEKIEEVSTAASTNEDEGDKEEGELSDDDSDDDSIQKKDSKDDRRKMDSCSKRDSKDRSRSGSKEGFRKRGEQKENRRANRRYRGRDRNDSRSPSYERSSHRRRDSRDARDSDRKSSRSSSHRDRERKNSRSEETKKITKISSSVVQVKEVEGNSYLDDLARRIKEAQREAARLSDEEKEKEKESRSSSSHRKKERERAEDKQSSRRQMSSKVEKVDKRSKGGIDSSKKRDRVYDAEEKRKEEKRKSSSSRKEYDKEDDKRKEKSSSKSIKGKDLSHDEMWKRLCEKEERGKEEDKKKKEMVEKRKKKSDKDIEVKIKDQKDIDKSSREAKDLRKKLQADRMKKKIERAVKHLHKRESTVERTFGDKSSTRESSLDIGSKDYSSPKRTKVSSRESPNNDDDDSRVRGAVRRKTLERDVDEIVKYEDTEKDRRSKSRNSIDREVSKIREEQTIDREIDVTMEQQLDEKRERKTENETISSINVYQSRLSSRAKRTIEGATKTVVDGNENRTERDDLKTDSYKMKKKNERTNINNNKSKNNETSFFERRKNHRLKAAHEQKQKINKQREPEKKHVDEDSLYEDIFAAVAATKCPPEKQKVKGKIFNRRHVNQLFIRGDNVVMIGYENPDDAKKVVRIEME